MDNSQSLRLIALYKDYKSLWDPNDSQYTNRGVREDAWRQISLGMDNMPVPELKKKMKFLSGGYRREKFREKQSRITGSGSEDTYKSKWFACDDFAFSADKNEPGTTRDTLQHEVMDNSTGGRNEENVNATATENDYGNTETQSGVNHQTEPINDTSNVQATPKTITNKRKKRTPKNTDDLADETLSEAFQLLQQCAQASQQETDHYTNFGQYISTELRKYDPITLAYVKNDICRVIFEADTGKYGPNNYGYYTSTYTAGTSNSLSNPHIASTPTINPQNPDLPTPSVASTPTIHITARSQDSPSPLSVTELPPQSPPNEI